MSNLNKTIVALVFMGCFFVSAQQAPKRSTASTSDTEARGHYKIAIAALQNNDLATAEDELKKAAQLTPRNATIYYNLAVVAEKRGDVHAADESLAKAQQLHLPADVKDQADTLRGEIDYKLQQEAKEAAVQQEANKRLDAINWLFGDWEAQPDYGSTRDGLWMNGFFGVYRAGNSVSGYWNINTVEKESGEHGNCFMKYDITNVTQKSAVDILIYLVEREEKKSGDPDLASCFGASVTLLMHRKDDGSLVGPSDTLRWTKR